MKSSLCDSLESLVSNEVILVPLGEELSGGTNIDDLERPWTPKMWVLSDFFAILGCDAHLEWIFAEICWR